MSSDRLSIIGLMAILFFGVVFSGGGTAIAGQDKDFSYIIAPKALDEVSLEVLYQTVVPLEKKETFKNIWVYGEHLLVLTNQNYLYVLDREQGRIRCGMRLTSSGLPVCKPAYANDKLWFMVGNQLIIVDPAICQVVMSKWCESIGSSSICNVGVNDEYFYVSGSTKRLSVIVQDGFWKKFHLTADDDSLINSIIATDIEVFFATASGSVVCVAANEPVKKWQQEVIGGIDVPLQKQGDWLYVGSNYGNVYKISAINGKFGWEDAFNTGAVLEEPVITGRLAVYQPAGEEGIYAIDKETGSQKWHLPSGRAFLMENSDRAYVLTSDGKLAVVGADRGIEQDVKMIDAAGADYSAVNLQDSTIYVANRDGRIMAIVNRKF